MAFSLRNLFSWATPPMQQAHYAPVFDPTEILLPSLFNRLIQVPLSQHAHVSIDQQRLFCDPSYIVQRELGSYKSYGLSATDVAAKNVVKLMDATRTFNLQNYIVYLREFREKVEDAYGGLYLIEPKARDIIVPKTEESAVKGGNLLQNLQYNNHKILWITGFNTSACVAQTAQHLILQSSFVINIIEDATDNCLDFRHFQKRKTLEILEANGANIVTVNQAYNFFKHQHESSLQNKIEPKALHI